MKNNCFQPQGTLFSLLISICFLAFVLCVDAHAVQCGNGVKEGVEECDNGSNNSDSQPDACRVDCTWHRCGDYVTDSDEECDDGPANSNQIPGACRKDCREAHCGDGVVDPQNSERCDDGNGNAYDGCHQCQECYLPKDDLVIHGGGETYVRLCPGRYELADEGQEGIIIINGSGVTVDGQGVTLVGIPQTMNAIAQQDPVSGAQHLVRQGVKSILGRTTRRRSMRTKSAESAGTSSGTPPTPGQTFSSRPQGVGIVVKGSDVVLNNVNVEKFKTGVHLESTGAVVFNNQLTGNSTDIVSDHAGNYGVKNRCKKYQNWKENGLDGCTFK